MKRNCSLIASVVLMFSHIAFGQDRPRMLLRLDDIGMCHSVNMAMKQFAETGMPFSTSVMFACPWYLEAAEILKAHPEVSVGIHLTLNSEWKNYKWGPVLGREAVPSLVDSNGYFFATHQAFDAHPVDPADVEKELRAQIKRALQTGLKIDYLDYHMNTPISKPEYRAIVEKLSKEYDISLADDAEGLYDTIWHIPAEGKKDTLLAAVARLQVGKVNMMIVHVGYEDPEMNALFDMDSPLMSTAGGASLVSKHRHAELQALCSPEFRDSIKKHNVVLITYREVLAKTAPKPGK